MSVGPTAPGPDPFQIGAVTFTRLECPESLPLGGGKHVVVSTELTGGSKVVQAFGAQIDDVNLTGRFWLDQVDNRVAAIRQMMVAGTEVPITWAWEKYYGIVSDFKPGYKHGGKAEWSLTITITRDGNGAYTYTGSQSLDSQASALMNDAQNAYNESQANDPGGTQDLGSALSGLQGML